MIPTNLATFPYYDHAECLAVSPALKKDGERIRLVMFIERSIFEDKEDKIVIQREFIDDEGKPSIVYPVDTFSSYGVACMSMRRASEILFATSDEIRANR